ncbi:Ras GTPase-activating protein-binding protein 2 [Taenia solium]|eukprot:TsM_000514100 transcript=TsM_000514100 gene=TsM_000514100
MVSNGDVCVEGLSLPKMDFAALSSLAEQFVLQYYTVMNKCPELLHRFYGEDSTLIFESQPICGQTEIHNAFLKLKLRDTRVTILKVDALKACNNSALVQISGEISVSNGPFRRFMRSFTLFEKSPADFYVLSDILRYQDRVYISPDGESKVASATEVKERTKPALEKSVAKVSSNGAAQEQKRQAHEKRSDAPQTVDQESEPRGIEAPVSPHTPTPKSPADAPTQRVVEKQSAAPVVQSQPAPPPPPSTRQSLPVAESQHQQPVAQQPVSTAPMSWAQRASGNIGSAQASVVTHRAQPQPAKPTPAEHPTVNTPTGGAQKVGMPKQTRGGARSHQTDIRRDSNGDRGDYSQIQSSQQQQFQHQQQPRGGFVQSGGARESMRNNGGGASRGNRGTGPARGGGGGNRGAGNPAPRR